MQTNNEFIEKYADQIAAAQQAWKALMDSIGTARADTTAAPDHAAHERLRQNYMDSLRQLKSAYVAEGLYMRDLRSADCRSGLDGNFHLIQEVITGEKAPAPSRFR